MLVVDSLIRFSVNSGGVAMSLAAWVRELAEKRDEQALRAQQPGTEKDLKDTAEVYRALARELDAQSEQMKAFRARHEEWRLMRRPFG
jgi:hypothetical protein